MAQAHGRRHIFLLFLAFALLLATPSSPAKVTHHHPFSRALVANITKDSITSLYSISLDHKPYVLDLAEPLLWSPCKSPHSTIPCNAPACRTANAYHPPPQCPLVKRRFPCTGCIAFPTNPATGVCAFGDLTLTTVSLSSTDGKNPTGASTFRNVIASCAPASLLKGLPSGSAGVAGFARSSVSLPWQLTWKKQIGICLPSESRDPGVAFFGKGPFFLITLQNIELTSLLQYTPLLKNSNNPGYYVKAKGLAVNQGAVPICVGNGRVKINPAVPYTTLRTQIYVQLLKAFDEATSGILQMPKVKPFDLCFNISALTSTRLGYGVASIDLMMDQGMRTTAASAGGGNWTIFGSNSLKQVDDQTACFAFVDGGPRAEEAMVIGGYQMENNFFLFDLEKSRVGFTSTVFGIMTTCSNFNYTLSA